MAAPDFPSSPTVGQTYVAPNTVTYRWDGAVWTSAAWVNTPAGGDLSGTYPNPTVIPAAKSKWTTTLTPVDTAQTVVLAPVGNALAWGSGTVKARLCAQGATDFQWRTNVNSAAATDDATKPSWAIRCDPAGDAFAAYRAAPGATASFAQVFLVNGADGKTSCTLADGTVTKPMLAAAATPRNWVSGPIPQNWTIPGKNTWYNFSSSSIMTTVGGFVVSHVYPAWQFLCFSTAPQGFYVGLTIDGVTGIYYRYHATAANNVMTPLPGFTTYMSCGAGNHSFKVDVYCETNASISTPNSANLGNIWHIEYA